MDRQLKVVAALLIVGVALLGATTTFSDEQARIHDTSPEAPETVERYEDPAYTVVAFEDMNDRGQSIYLDAITSGGEWTRPIGEGVGHWPYDEQRYLIVDRAGNDSLPPADEDDPDSRYDAMNVDTGSEDLPLPELVVRLLTHVLGIGAILIALAIAFFSE